MRNIEFIEQSVFLIVMFLIALATAALEYTF